MAKRAQTRLLPALLVLGACAGPAATSGSGPAGGTTTSSVTAMPGGADQTFANAMHEDGQTEVLSASYASSKLTTPAVKAYAQKTLADFANLNVGLNQAATKGGLTVTNAPATTQIQAVNTMNALTGSAYEKAYLASEVRRHETMVREFGKEAANGTVPALKQWAQDRLPLIQAQLDQARSLSAG